MQSFRQHIAQRLAPLVEQEPAAVAAQLGMPPKPDMGDLGWPCFALAKARKQPPPALAADIASKFNSDGETGDQSIMAVATGPYLNFRIHVRAMHAAFHQAAMKCASGTWVTQPAGDDGQKPRIAIDFSSPNIAKQFSIAHLRSTALGWSLIQIYRFMGFDTVGINHLGDWGTQFGLLIDGFQRQGDAKQLDEDPIRYLHDLYVELSAKAKEDPEVKERARAAFLALERGEPKAVELWKKFRDLSLREFFRVYDILGVSFDNLAGESFYVDKVEPIYERFVKAGLVRLDDGAMVIDTPGTSNKNPMLVRKSDGATTYALRDLAGVDHRYRTYRYARNVYVVDMRQGPHFEQVFVAYGLLGAEEKRAADRCVHTAFGTVKLDGEIMSTRTGKVMLLEEYLEGMAGEVKKVMAEKGTVLPDNDATARDIGMGAVVFEMLKRERRNDVHFSRESMLQMDGETGPRVQYLHARLCSLARQYQETFGEPPPPVDQTNTPWPDAPPEVHALLRVALDLGDVLDRSLGDNEPSHVAIWLIRLADSFNVFWRAARVIDPADQPGSRARMALMTMLRVTIHRALSLLGVRAPERM